MTIVPRFMFGLLCGVLFLGLLAGCGGSGGIGVLPVFLTSIEVIADPAEHRARHDSAVHRYRDLFGHKQERPYLVRNLEFVDLPPPQLLLLHRGWPHRLPPVDHYYRHFGGSIGRATLTVTPATLGSIGVSPASAATIALGTSQQFTAIGMFSDGTTQVPDPM